MIQILLLLIKDRCSVLLRNLYWLYRLSKIKFGKAPLLRFPIKVEGKGVIFFGNNSVLEKNVSLGVGQKGLLHFGDNVKLDRESTLLVVEQQSLKIGSNFALGQGSRLYVQNTWKFGNAVKIGTNCSIFARESGLAGKLEIGSNCNIGDFALIDLVDNVIIENDVAIGPNCTLYTHDHIYTDKDVPSWKGGVISKPIIIKKEVWIGSGVTILPGVTIGERAVIAAGSVVTKNVESHSIYGGVPAKMIKVI